MKQNLYAYGALVDKCPGTQTLFGGWLGAVNLEEATGKAYEEVRKKCPEMAISLQVLEIPIEELKKIIAQHEQIANPV